MRGGEVQRGDVVAALPGVRVGAVCEQDPQGLGVSGREMKAMTAALVVSRHETGISGEQFADGPDIASRACLQEIRAGHRDVTMEDLGW